MSGRVRAVDAPVRPGRGRASSACLQIGESLAAAGGECVRRAWARRGRPSSQEILMSWDLVARGRQELSAAHASSQAREDRFGRVGSPPARLRARTPSRAVA